ncbi:hypothetical protein TWF694_006755 [Orbilia ellipsospora]|uniref:Acyltransferase 3 domain-containing protein n=1 Tax=Orbilia ellipsospora TaxID=2528407 RepID=A0AAV9XL24_9PEZI
MPIRIMGGWLRGAISALGYEPKPQHSLDFDSENGHLLSSPSILTVAPVFARHSLRSCFYALTPSFLHPTPASTTGLPGPQTNQPRSTLAPTAYLDGLRGTAAFFVFIYHFLYTYFPSLEYGFLHGNDDLNPLQLPVIRVFMCGASMVSIFFVISGFALSYKSIRQIRNRDQSSVLTTLSSSTFRRAFRLNLPTLASVMFIALLIRMGAFTWVSKNVPKKKHIFPGWQEDDIPILTGFWRQLYDAARAWWLMSNPFMWKEYYILYDLHLWTIPIEFRCSIVVFMSLLGLSRVKSWVRMVTLSMMAVVSFFYYDRWDIFCFLSGVVIAEISIIRAENKIKGNNLLLFPILLIGLHMASMPADPGHTPGYRLLQNMIPSMVKTKGRFWQSVSAVIIVTTISFGTSSGLQRPFTTRFAQYLGKISYAMYLMHGWVCRSLGYWTVAHLWKYTGRDTILGKVSGVLGGGVLVFITVFWTSDIFWRSVDMGSVRFARWLENVCLAKTDEDEKDLS